MKLHKDKFYKVTDPTGTKFIAQYAGLQENCDGLGIECMICCKDIRDKSYQLNIPYDEKNAQNDIDEMRYETWYYGTACFKRLKFENIE